VNQGGNGNPASTITHQKERNLGKRRAGAGGETMGKQHSLAFGGSITMTWFAHRRFP